MKRRQRRRVFFGCEGGSERSYAVLLSRFFEVQNLNISLDPVALEPGGDPRVLVNIAIKKIDREETNGVPYRDRFILLDDDVLERKPDEKIQVINLAKEHNIRLIWQRPCHEALLLHHFEGAQKLRPSTCKQSQEELNKRWPNFDKNLSADRLASKLNVEGVRRAAGEHPDFLDFLNSVGLR